MDRISIANVVRMWDTHEGEIQDELDLEYWEAPYSSDLEDNIIQSSEWSVGC